MYEGSVKEASMMYRSRRNHQLEDNPDIDWIVYSTIEKGEGGSTKPQKGWMIRKVRSVTFVLLLPGWEFNTIYMSGETS